MTGVQTCALPIFAAKQAPIITGFNDVDWVTADCQFAQEVRAVHDSLVADVMISAREFPGDLSQLLRLRAAVPKRDRSRSHSGPLSVQRYLTLQLEASLLACLIGGRVYPGGTGRQPKVLFSEAPAHSPGPFKEPATMAFSTPAERQEWRARLGVLCLPHASLPISAIPLSPSLTVSDFALRSALRLRLGLVPVLQSIPPKCDRCDTVIEPLFRPFHPFSCGTRKNGQIVRHTALNSALKSIATAAGLIVTSDQLTLTVPAPANTRGLIPDSLLSGPGIACMVDVSVVCSSAPSYRARCASRPASALFKRVHDKEVKYTDAVESLGYSFAPVVMDALGVPHSSVVFFLDDIAARAVSNGMIHDSSRKSFLKTSLTQLAFAVLEGNVTLFRDCWPLLGPLLVGGAAHARAASVSDDPVSDFMSSPGSARGGSDTHGLRRDDVDDDDDDDDDDLNDASSVAAAARAPAMPSGL